MKRLLCGLMVALVALSAFAAGGRQAASTDETIVLKYGHQNAMDNLVHIYSEKWAADVLEKSGGRIVIEIYPASQLGNLREMMEAVELGTLDITLGDTSMLSTVLPEFGLLALPFIFRDYDHAEAVIDGDVGETLNRRLAAERNMRPLGWFWNGFRNFATKTPITRVADARGIKMRSPEARIYMDTFSMLGMSPTPIPWGEVYTALASGVVDAAESGPEHIYKQDFYRHAPYVTNSRHIFSVVGPMVNEQVWQSLSAADQRLLMDSLEDIVRDQRVAAIDEEGEYYRLLIDAGATITEFENPQELIDLFTPYWSDYAANSNSKDLLQQLMAKAN